MTHIVFDLDGTLTDTQKIHQQIESDFLQTKGIYIDPNMIGIKYAGRTPQEWITEVIISNNKEFSKQELDDFVSKKDKIIIDFLKNGKIDFMPYAFEILNYLYLNDYKIGISSGACREFIDDFISYFKLEKIISASTSANEVVNKKPNPDVFISSFNKLSQLYGLSNSKYVIGDGWSDMEGGYKSGAKTVWLNYCNKSKLNELYCNYEIKTLIELKSIL